ncbi:MAG: hypothetical protein GF401_19495 [Chitinivibrionales bacterium]|nr:hypothetical protein [Chitinivibrionales bacterium]
MIVKALPVRFADSWKISIQIKIYLENNTFTIKSLHQFYSIVFIWCSIYYFRDVNSGIEKRRYPRANVSFVTVEVYTRPGVPESPEMCFVINLSEDGMMFRSDREYELGQVVLLTFSLPSNEVIIKNDATIIHSRKVNTSTFCGVQFKSMALAERKYLRDFIANLIEQNPEKEE